MEFVQTLKEFPPRQKAASFNPEHAVSMLEAGATGG